MGSTSIKDFYGRVIGYIEEDSQGNKIVKDFYRRIIGRYEKKQNVTKNFYGQIVAKGDICSSLIFQANAEEEARKKKN